MAQEHWKVMGWSDKDLQLKRIKIKKKIATVIQFELDKIYTSLDGDCATL